MTTPPRTDPSGPDASTAPPVARRDETVLVLHGDRRVDAYGWLHDTANVEVLDHLAAERAYYDARTAGLRPVADRLFAAMSARVAPEDTTVAHRMHHYAYRTHIPPGGEYEQFCRVPLTDAGPAWRSGVAFGAAAQVLLDPADLLGGSSYVELGLSVVSPDERTLAYSVDTVGDEVYRLAFRDLETGADLPDAIERTYYGGAWSADSSTFFYTVHDEKYRPYQVYRHRLGTPISDDTLVLEESDERYELELRACRSGDVIVVDAISRDTREVWLLDAHDPSAPARCIEPRRPGVEYAVEHVRTPAGERLFIVTNDEAPEYRLMSAPLDSPGRSTWVELAAERSDERLHEVTAFAGHVVTTFRRDCLLMARAYAIDSDGGLALPGVEIAAGIPGGGLELTHNDWFEARAVTVVEQSYVSPKAWYDVDLDTGERTQVQRQEVPGYDPTAYVSELRWAPVSAAVDVPVTIVRRTDTPLDGTAPCLQYGYGAYEACFEPEFDVALTALLDEGAVFAFAHIRGGGEGGRRWWLDGRLGRKQNTFTDHIAVADFLADGVVDGTRIVTRGLSAGGLLQGAVFSQAPERWRGVIAEVPFVDVVTTMLNPSIPLTITEWDEWGDPQIAEQYAWLAAYSPYDNPPPAGNRPDLLVTGALHDPRVMVFEPAKWVALLRYTDPGWSPRCLFRCELGAGAHIGPSGRFGHLHYEAEIYAWTLARF